MTGNPKTLVALSERLSMIRMLAVLVLALAFSFQVARSAIVDENLANRPELAQKIWPSHPRVQFARAMADIGTSASEGRTPSHATIAISMAAATRAPLAIEPFLIGAAVAQISADSKKAEALLVEASSRDPRSGAARFLLAQHYLARGRIAEGLRHAVVLIRLSPGASGALIPAIAEFARAPSAWPVLRGIFDNNPEMRGAVLANLANDADNYAIIIALAGGNIGPNELASTHTWQTQLLRALIDRGKLAEAYSLWLKISGLRAGPSGIYNPTFATLASPPPFNWSFGNGDFGVAEAGGNNLLQVIHYGRSNAEFASQTVRVAPGDYQLRMRVTRDAASRVQSGLAWSVSCLPAGKNIAVLPLGDGSGQARLISARFTVDEGCKFQQIQLGAVAAKPPSFEQVTIGDLQLVRLNL